MIRRITGIILGVLAFFLVYWITGLGTPSEPNWALAALVGLVVALIWPWLFGLYAVRRVQAEAPGRDRPGSPEAARAAAEQPAAALLLDPRDARATRLTRRVIARATDRFIPRLLVDAPDFRRLWVGQTISVLGDQVTQLGLPLVAVLTLGADAGQMGTLTAVGVLPHLLFSLPAGVWLDRVRSRRRLMVIADIGRAAIVASIPLAFALGLADDAPAVRRRVPRRVAVGRVRPVVEHGLRVGHAARAVRRGDVAAQRQPVAGLRRRPDDRRAPGPGARRAAGDAGRRAVVPRLGGLPAPDPGARTAHRGRSPGRSAGGSCRGSPSSSGTRSSGPRCSPSRRSTCSPSRSGRCSSCTSPDTLGVSPGALGLALGVGAVGGLIGAVIASRIGRRIGLGPAYALGCVVFPVSLLTIPIAGPDMSMPVILALILASEFGAGLGVMILDINIGSINNARIPDALRARANGAYRFINYGVRPVGAILGGLLGTAIGVREALFVSAVAASLGVLWMVGSPVLRLRDLPDAAVGGVGRRAGTAPRAPGTSTNRPGPTTLDGRPRR